MDVEHMHVSGRCKRVAPVLARIGDKWAVLVVETLADGPVRFNALKREIGVISQRMLTFTLRGLEAKNARLGLVECVNHDLLQPYPVLHEKPNTLVAHFKTTVLLMPNGSDRITSAPVQELKSEKQVSLPHLACPRH